MPTLTAVCKTPKGNPNPLQVHFLHPFLQHHGPQSVLDEFKWGEASLVAVWCDDELVELVDLKKIILSHELVNSHYLTRSLFFLTGVCVSRVYTLFELVLNVHPHCMYTAVEGVGSSLLMACEAAGVFENRKDLFAKSVCDALHADVKGCKVKN